MTYGFKVKNANGEVTVSDSQFNPEYVGLATFQPPAGEYYWNYNTNNAEFIPFTGSKVTTVYNDTWLRAATAKYRITYPTARGEPIPFIVQNSKVNWGASLSYFAEVSSSGSNTTWEIVLNIVSAGANNASGVPDVMVFSKLPINVSPIGHGIVVKTADQNIAFASDRKHLLPNQVLTYTSPACQNTNVNRGSGSQPQYYCVYSPSSQTLTNLPANAAFFFKNDISDFSFHASFYFASYRANCLVGRIANGRFESSVALHGRNQTTFSYTMPRGNEPVIIIDANKYL
jgi:hypothetical protein